MDDGHWPWHVEDQASEADEMITPTPAPEILARRLASFAQVPQGLLIASSHWPGRLVLPNFIFNSHPGSLDPILAQALGLTLYPTLGPALALCGVGRRAERRTHHWVLASIPSHTASAGPNAGSSTGSSTVVSNEFVLGGRYWGIK